MTRAMKFRLLEPHYIRVLNHEDYFEQKETLMDGSGEAKTVRCRVDRYLHPDDAAMWNWDPANGQYRKPGTFRAQLGERGWLVVTTKAEGKPYELVVSAPSIQMEGIDDAAQAVIEKLRASVLEKFGITQLNPVDALPATGGIK